MAVATGSLIDSFLIGLVLSPESYDFRMISDRFDILIFTVTIELLCKLSHIAPLIFNHVQTCKFCLKSSVSTLLTIVRFHLQFQALSKA
jgi:hypothetical protein